jgi:hypothetical protein
MYNEHDDNNTTLIQQQNAAATTERNWCRTPMVLQQTIPKSRIVLLLLVTVLWLVGNDVLQFRTIGVVDLNQRHLQHDDNSNSIRTQQQMPNRTSVAAAAAMTTKDGEQHDRSSPAINDDLASSSSLSSYPDGEVSSAHLCHSWDVSDQPHASCWYQNLCVQRPPGWNASQGDETLQFLYISDQNDEEPIPITLGVAENRRAPELNIRPSRISREAFANLSQTSSSSSSAVRYIPGTSVLWYEYILSNFGHVLTDNLLPIFSLLDSFLDKPTIDVKVFEYKTARPLGFNCEAQYNARWVRRDANLLAKIKKDCERFGPMMFPMITKHPVSLLSSLFSFSDASADDSAKMITPNMVCFQNLFVGYPLLNLAHHHHLDPYKQDTRAGRDSVKPVVNLGWHGRQSQLWRFRQYTMQNLGLADSPKVRNLVVIWNRNDKKRMLRDLTGFATYVRQMIPDAEVIVTEFVGMDLPQQIQLMSQAAVHITGPGGGSFIGMYLPRGATMIRLYAADYLMELPFFNALGYIHVDHLGCTSSSINHNITKGEAVLCGNSNDDSGMSFTSLLNLVQIGLHRRQRFATMSAGELFVDS